MTDTIYKITVKGEDINGAGTEKLLFNNAITDTVGNAYILRVNHKRPKGVSGNQALGQGTIDQQPVGQLGEFYTIEGVIPFQDGTINASGTGVETNSAIVQLKTWENELDTIDGQIIHGQYGLELNSVPDDNSAPISTGNTQIGLLWVELDWNYDIILNIAKFVLKFKVDRGDDS